MEYETFKFILILSLFSCITKAQKSLFPQNQDLSRVESTEYKVYKVPKSQFRLPSSFLPYHYEVRVRPILELIPGDAPQWTAPGSVKIFGTCVSPTSNITLHSSVTINEASVLIINLSTMDVVSVKGHAYDEEKTFYIIELGEILTPGLRYSIYINYVAQIESTVFEGMYQNYYVDPKTGEKIFYIRYSIATQLQAFGARRVFPCFDEPGMKATFDITIGRRSNYTTICNAPMINSIPIPGMDGWFWDIYNSTVRMPTYLIALIVGDFTFDEADPLIYHKPVKTFGPKHLIDIGYGGVASDIAAHSLYFFESFFDIEYAMHKMDSIGIINFPGGAMENWGLNIYSENYLLYSPTYNNERDRRGVAFTLNHELSHQWFGNLITCDWWTMAWLNEGFATYLSYVGMDYTNPEYDPMKLLQYERIHVSFRNDDLENSHPTVLPEKGNPWDTMTYNANLVYSKGAALLRMMEGFLTRTTLQKALQTFLKAFAFQPVNQDQLFKILTSQAYADHRLPVGATMKDIMDTWTLQRRYPVVNVVSTAENTVVLTQSQYKADNESRVYYIPIAIATQSEPNIGNTLPQYWLYTELEGISLNHNSSEWIVANSGGTGYYRVKYDTNLCEKLQKQLLDNHELLELGTRTQLIDDYFTFAYDNNTEVEKALRFTKYLSKETESSVWYSVFFHLSKPGELLAGTIFADAFKQYMSPRLGRALSNLLNSGADVTVGEASLYHATLLYWISVLNMEQIDELAFAYYETWKANPDYNPIPQLIRTQVHRIAIGRARTDENFLFAISQYRSGNETDQSKNEIMDGLGMRSDKVSVNTLLGALTGATSGLDANSVISALAFNPENRPALLSFLSENFDDIILHEGNTATILRAIDELCSRFSTTEHLIIVQDFIESHSGDFSFGDEIKLDVSVAKLRGNIDWMTTYGNSIGNWMQKNN